MATGSPREHSRFLGAAAMFRKKEMDLATDKKTKLQSTPRRSRSKSTDKKSTRQRLKSTDKKSPLRQRSKSRHKKTTRLRSNSTDKESPRQRSTSTDKKSPSQRSKSTDKELKQMQGLKRVKDIDLDSPMQYIRSLVHDSHKISKSPHTPGWKARLNKSNGELEGRNGSATIKKKSTHALSPPPYVSPGHGKASNDPRNSWKNSGTLSPPPFAKNSPSKYSVPFNTNKWKSNAPPSPHTGHKFNNYNAEPDVKIQVKSDIRRSINTRKQKHSYGSQNNSRQSRSFSSSQNQGNVPEHIQKAREREQRRLRALEEIECQSASLLQAIFLGWYVRTVKYPALRTAYIKRRKRILAILTIQKTFRMHVQRKRYIHAIARKRRLERNKKEIKRMQKKIEKLPKKTKQDIKEKKKEYELRKKEMLNKALKQIKEDDEKIRWVKDSGRDMIKYLNEENSKVRDLINTIQREQTVLEKQFEVLTAKSGEIASNFKSLQKWVDSKNESILKNGASDQKCRYRYLPKYRNDLATRNKYCITEFRVKELYKRQLEKIVKEVEAKSTDLNLVKHVQKEKKSCHKLLKEMTDNPLPEGLEHRLKY
jgi:hypothetical protein